MQRTGTQGRGPGEAAGRPPRMPGPMVKPETYLSKAAIVSYLSRVYSIDAKFVEPFIPEIASMFVQSNGPALMWNKATPPKSIDDRDANAVTLKITLVRAGTFFEYKDPKNKVSIVGASLATISDGYAKWNAEKGANKGKSFQHSTSFADEFGTETAPTSRWI